MLYDNPIALYEANQKFINRTLFSVLLYDYEIIRDENGNYIEQRLRDDYEMAGTFMKDLRISQSAIFDMDNMQQNISFFSEETEKEHLINYQADAVAKQLAEIRSASAARAVINRYREFVKDTEGGDSNSDNGWSVEQKALWEKIVGPYKGNILFLDFWSMGCAPCRSDMLSQKRIIEELKNQPVKFLYINQTPEQQAAEQWMTEKEIKGEHIYITPDEWKQFMVMIDFQAIPRGVIVGKNGKIKEKEFRMDSYPIEMLKMMVEKL